AVSRAMAGSDMVVHFAAESHVDRSITEPAVFLKTNVIGTHTLLEAAREHQVKRFHHVSTDEVYGSLKFDDTELFHELRPHQPNSPYAASKSGSDMLVRAYWHTFQLSTTISNTSNNYGAYQFPEKLIPLMILNALHNRPLPVYGDGKNIRDWIHVTDHCRAIDLIIHQGQPGETYCVGGDSERQNIEVVRDILQLLNKPESLITYVKDRPGHDQRYAIDSSKIKRELGFTHTYNWTTGLAETVKWYQGHADWWRPLLNEEYQKYYQKIYEQR
ncbi:MAG: dTDP-glucose 4,6-dehydratase, partial [bacterium]|nr:dTDP-glucose 4,6-dehydratase [bacterium]